eukprot:Hpha_TRINITY_DN1694_c0_g1::TRINITY_DN1694_c0_g1_i1::g.48792::m.48792
MINDTDEHVFKVVLIGQSGVGKTHMLMVFCDGVAKPKDVTPTVGVEFRAKRIDCGRTPVRLQLWDLAGREENRYGDSGADRRVLYEHAVLCIFVYDVALPSTLDALGSWLREVPDPRGMVLMILANNPSGVPTSRWAIPDEMGSSLAERNGALFASIASANREAEALEAAFVVGTREVLSRLQGNPERSADPLPAGQREAVGSDSLSESRSTRLEQPPAKPTPKRAVGASGGSGAGEGVLRRHRDPSGEREHECRVGSQQSTDAVGLAGSDTAGAPSAAESRGRPARSDPRNDSRDRSDRDARGSQSPKTSRPPPKEDKTSPPPPKEDKTSPAAPPPTGVMSAEEFAERPPEPQDGRRLSGVHESDPRGKSGGCKCCILQ